MTHPVAELTAYLDGALAEDERQRIAEHLTRCTECRREHDRLAAALSVLAQLPPPPQPSPTFEQRFYARLAAERAVRPALAVRLGLRWRGAWRWLTPGLAGAVAAAAVMIYTGARHRADEAFIAAHLDLFEDYEAVASLGAVDDAEDVQIVAHLDELREGGP